MITTIYIHPTTSEKFLIEYEDADSFDHLSKDRCKQTYGVCFCDDKMVIGFGGMKSGWGLIGGSIEAGETFEQTLTREIQEESNMQVLKQLPVGYQKVTPEGKESFYQLRYVCMVRPLGPFVVDGGDGMSKKGITEIKLIDPVDAKKYFDWGEIGDRIIERAIELKSHW
jgi:ADP-ribose pyrophosphatase YjhB (NUDIX family)